MSLAILGITIITLIISYRYYAIRKVNREVEPSWSRSTPSRRYMDGKDYLPTSKYMLAGFQFKSISLDVIIGPVIAIQFGWLPAFLWLLIGAIFFGWVQDYLVTIMSMRKAGSPVSDLMKIYFGPRSRPVILSFLFAYLLIIMGQYGVILSTLLGRENVAIGIMFLVLAGITAGMMIYRWHMNFTLSTLIAVLIALFGFWLASQPFSQELVTTFNQIIGGNERLTIIQSPGAGFITWQSLIWLLILFAVCYLGAVLPIWRFSVPLNYVSSWIVLLAVVLAIGGLILGTLNGRINISFEIPPLVSTYQPNLGPLWPILFVTLSSGAISGWHALVSSFSTSHQVEKEPYTLPITTGAMYAETIMVAIVIIFAATFGVSSGTYGPEQNFSLVAGPASILSIGMTKTLSSIGFSESIGGTFSALFLTLMGLTVLQLVLRITRKVSADMFGKKIPALSNPKISTLFVIVLTLIIILFGFWQWLWVLFGGANLLLAGLVLMLASTWLAKQRKSYQWTLWPGIFLFVTALAALFYVSIYQVLIQWFLSGSEIISSGFLGNSITFLFGIFFMAAGTYLFFIGWQAFTRARKLA
jgi:carbon starvation protein